MNGSEISGIERRLTSIESKLDKYFEKTHKIEQWRDDHVDVHKVLVISANQLQQNIKEKAIVNDKRITKLEKFNIWFMSGCTAVVIIINLLANWTKLLSMLK